MSLPFRFEIGQGEMNAGEPPSSTTRRKQSVKQSVQKNDRRRLHTKCEQQQVNDQQV